MRNYKIDFLPFKKNYFKFLAFLYIKESISIYFKVFFFFNSIYTCHDFIRPTSTCVRPR